MYAFCPADWATFESLFFNIGSQVYSYTIKTNSVVLIFIMKISNAYLAYENFNFYSLCASISDFFMYAFESCILYCPWPYKVLP